MTSLWAVLALSIVIVFLVVATRTSAIRFGRRVAEWVYRLVPRTSGRDVANAASGADAFADERAFLQESPRRFEVYVADSAEDEARRAAPGRGETSAQPYVPGQPRSGERVGDLALRIQEKAGRCDLKSAPTAKPHVRDVLLVREDRRGGPARITHVLDMPLPPGVVFRARGQSLEDAAADLATMILLGPQPTPRTRSGYLCREGDAWAWFRIAPTPPDVPEGEEDWD